MPRSVRTIRNVVFECITVGFGLLALLMSLGSWANADEYNYEKEILAPIDRVVVEPNFTVNSNVYLDVKGTFMNGCYKWIRPEVLHTDQHLHEVRAVALYRDGFCTMAIIPFQHRIYLGNLTEGIHTIRVFDAYGYQEQIVKIVP